MQKLRHELPLELPEKTHTALSDYLNNGGIADLAEPLDYLLAQSDLEQVIIQDETGEFSAQWIHKPEKRILAVRSNLGHIAGLHLSIPVEAHSYQLAHGDVGASLQPRLEQGNRPKPYLKLAGGMQIGDPNNVLYVQQIAANELWQASGL